MPKPDKAYRKKEIAGRQLAPETLVMGYGFDPHLSEGAIKPPIFQTSTFVFRTAEAGEDFFAQSRGEKGSGEDAGLVYTRINNPNLEVLEDRLTLYDGGEDALAFASGMGAITTALLSFVQSGSVVLHSSPIYGATETFIRNTLPNFGVKTAEFLAAAPEAETREAVANAQAKGPITVIYTETPANPTNDLVDLELMARLCDEIAAKQDGVRPVLMCDNTFLGPVGQTPIRNGVDLVLYSLTKYVGGHSDLIAGAAIGSAEVIKRVRSMRTAMGAVPDPHTCWLLLRSLETVKLRMEASFANAQACAEFLRNHPKVERVRYLGFLEDGSPQKDVYDRHCSAPGSTFSFDVVDGRDGAFRMLNKLMLVKLAVSLGGTESLICHPGSTTHSGVPRDLRLRIGFTPGLVRFSVGLENPDDLIADLEHALEAV